MTTYVAAIRADERRTEREESIMTSSTPRQNADILAHLRSLDGNPAAKRPQQDDGFNSAHHPGVVFDPALSEALGLEEDTVGMQPSMEIAASTDIPGAYSVDGPTIDPRAPLQTFGVHMRLHPKGSLPS